MIAPLRDFLSAFPFGPVFFSGSVAAFAKRASPNTSVGFRVLYRMVQP